MGQYNFTYHLNSIHHAWQCKRRISSCVLSYSGLSGRAGCIVDILKRKKGIFITEIYIYICEFLYELTCIQANNDVLDIILALESVLNRMQIPAMWGRISVVFFPVVNLEVILGGVFLDMLHWNERQNCFCVIPLCLCASTRGCAHSGSCRQCRHSPAAPAHPLVQLSEAWHKISWVWSLSSTCWAGVKIQLFLQVWHSAWGHYARHGAFVRPKQPKLYKLLLDCSAPLSMEKQKKK